MVLQKGEWLGQQAKQMLVSLNDLGLLLGGDHWQLHAVAENLACMACQKSLLT